MFDNQPVIIRKDTFESFQFRIRNLFNYEENNFIVSVEDKDNCILIKTTTKKYYKKIYISEIKDNNIKLNNQHLSYNFLNNVLIINVILLV